MNTKHNTFASAKEPQLSLFPDPVKETPESLPDTVHQYFFIISPPDAVKSKVKSLKHKLNTAVGLSDHNLHSVPHISLMSFHTMWPVNDRFMQVVQQLFSEIHCFEVKLHGYEHFVHGSSSDTIYVKLSDSDKIKLMYQELHNLLGLRVRSFVPHLAIAQTIPRANFGKSFSIVKKHSFDEEFVCETVTLLERKLQHGVAGKYRVLKEIKLAA